MRVVVWREAFRRNVQAMLKRLFLQYIAEEARPMLRLAIPLVLAELAG